MLIAGSGRRVAGLRRRRRVGTDVHVGIFWKVIKDLTSASCYASAVLTVVTFVVTKRRARRWLHSIGIVRPSNARVSPGMFAAAVASPITTTRVVVAIIATFSVAILLSISPRRRILLRTKRD